tara:strand:- start:1515 stop:1748 length:234 start_codon:yes stop_codon:yes gene_type:complete
MLKLKANNKVHLSWHGQDKLPRKESNPVTKLKKPYIEFNMPARQLSFWVELTDVIRESYAKAQSDLCSDWPHRPYVV